MTLTAVQSDIGNLGNQCSYLLVDFLGGICTAGGQNGKWGSTGFYGPVHLGRYWSVTSRHWSNVYLQYLDRVADVKKTTHNVI